MIFLTRLLCLCNICCHRSAKTELLIRENDKTKNSKLLMIEKLYTFFGGTQSFQHLATNL